MTFSRFLPLLSLFSLRTYAQTSAASDKDGWYKDAVIYSVDVKVFKDADGNGVGDFKGMIQKLGYIASLGINTIWLAPFQPSPLKDDGYDITDYEGIDPRVGTKTDFLAFVDSCHRRKIRVIMDLVLDHTSDQHRWFTQSARSENGYRDWFFWQKNRPVVADSGAAFPGVQKETWSYYPSANAYYYHRFYDFQPHLNFYLPAVRKIAAAVLRYWLSTGVDGFRVDAVPFMIEKPDPDKDTAYQLLTYIPEMRRVVSTTTPGALLLGEANVLPKDVDHFTGKKGEGMQMLFNFYVNQYLFYGLASGDISPLRKALIDTKIPVPGFEWVYFLRNHDEVDLGRLDSTRQQLAFKVFGPASNMQLYHRGVRRRLAPMLGDSLKKIELAYAITAGLPGAFMIRYGEELGMGDDLSLQERLSVRTPMQWDNTREAGFTSTEKPLRPVVADSLYGFPTINVTAETADSASLLQFIRRLIQIRKNHPEISNGRWEIADSSLSQVLVIHYEFKGKQSLVVANLSSQDESFSLSTARLPVVGLRGLFNKEDFITAINGVFRFLIPAETCEWYDIISVENNK